MRVSVSARKPSGIESDFLVLITDEALKPFDLDAPDVQPEIERYAKGASSARIKRPDMARAPQGYAARALLLCGIEMGSRKHYPESEKIRAVAHEIYKYCEGIDRSKISILLNGPDGPALAAHLAQGFLLGAYTFNDYRKPRKFAERFRVRLLVQPAMHAQAKEIIAESLRLAQCVNDARDLINRPGSVAVPSYLAEQAQWIAAETGLECEILDENRLRDEGYNGLLTVGKGGNHPPRMIILRYKPENAPSGKHLCLLGKGITFDTGGLCLKSGTAMWEMVDDMSGAAAVLESMKAIALSKPSLRVTGIMVCAQNDIGAKSMKPGDCFIARNGKSVHVLNTDAEGRLILSDGLYRAGEEGATHIVDVATLTGACKRAFGESISGLFCNDPVFQELLRTAGEEEGEIMWPLPLFQEYRSLLDHYRADINNMSKSSEGGAITAALFLQEFVPEGAAWAHLDIAGTAFSKSSWRYLSPGGRGIMVRTFYRLAQKMAETSG